MVGVNRDVREKARPRLGGGEKIEEQSCGIFLKFISAISKHVATDGHI